MCARLYGHPVFTHSSIAGVIQLGAGAPVSRRTNTLSSN